MPVRNRDSAHSDRFNADTLTESTDHAAGCHRFVGIRSAKSLKENHKNLDKWIFCRCGEPKAVPLFGNYLQAVMPNRFER
jgi:hypothetical protein